MDAAWQTLQRRSAPNFSGMMGGMQQQPQGYQPGGAGSYGQLMGGMQQGGAVPARQNQAPNAYGPMGGGGQAFGGAGLPPMMPPSGGPMAAPQAGAPAPSGMGAGGSYQMQPQTAPQAQQAPPMTALGGGAQYNQQRPMNPVQQFRANNPGQPLWGPNGMHGRAWGTQYQGQSL